MQGTEEMTETSQLYCPICMCYYQEVEPRAATLFTGKNPFLLGFPLNHPARLAALHHNTPCNAMPSYTTLEKPHPFSSREWLKCSPPRDAFRTKTLKRKTLILNLRRQNLELESLSAPKILELDPRPSLPLL